MAGSAWGFFFVPYGLPRGVGESHPRRRHRAFYACIHRALYLWRNPGCVPLDSVWHIQWYLGTHLSPDTILCAPDHIGLVRPAVGDQVVVEQGYRKDVVPLPLKVT